MTAPNFGIVGNGVESSAHLSDAAKVELKQIGDNRQDNFIRQSCLQVVVTTDTRRRDMPYHATTCITIQHHVQLHEASFATRFRRYFWFLLCDAMLAWHILSL